MDGDAYSEVYRSCGYLGENKGYAEGCEGHVETYSEEVIAELVEVLALRFTHVVSQRDHPGYEGCTEEGVEREVEHVPEPKVKPTNFVELRDFVEEEARGHEVEDSLHDIEIARRIDRVDSNGVEHQIQHGKEHLHCILIQRRPHPIRVKMRRIQRIRLVLVRHKPAWVLFVLH